MKTRNSLIRCQLILVLMLTFGGTVRSQSSELDLKGEIFAMDSVLFDAFNKKDIETIKTIFSEDLEFYHDKDGFKNYQRNIADMERIFNNNDIHVVRTGIKESFEIYPMGDYGALQIGTHQFCNTENGSTGCGNFKFVNIWKRTEQGWKLSRVISYDH